MVENVPLKYLFISFFDFICYNKLTSNNVRKA